MTEIFFDGKTIVSKDFRISELHHEGKTQTFKTNSQEMGYGQELKAFIDCAVGTSKPDLSMSEMFATMDIIFAIEKSLATGQSISSSVNKAVTA